MSWIIPWNGVDHDVDPGEFTGREMKLVKDRTGLTYRTLIEAVAALDGEAVCALFWVVARRSDPDLKFTDFDGPPMKLVIDHFPEFGEVMDDLGKALTRATNGSPSSPTDSDGTETSTTD